MSLLVLWEFFWFLVECTFFFDLNILDTPDAYIPDKFQWFTVAKSVQEPLDSGLKFILPYNNQHLWIPQV